MYSGRSRPPSDLPSQLKLLLYLERLPRLRLPGRVNLCCRRR